MLFRSAWVPVDDEHTMFFMMGPKPGQAGASSAGPRMLDNEYTTSLPLSGQKYLPASTHPLERWKLAANRSNDYQIDRAMQKHHSYTGLTGIHLQDQAITESMGPIYDRSKERLGTSDMMIIRTRKRLIDAAKALRDHGTPPPAFSRPELYGVRTGGTVLPRDATWVEATAHLRAGFVEHEGLDSSVLGASRG